MVDLGFIQANSDHALFYYKETNVTANQVWIRCFLAWHVNDGMGVCNSHPFLENVKKRITEHFGIKDLGAVAKYLGIQFKRDHISHKIWLHQSEYITFLLQEYDLTNCNPVLLPADPKAPLGDPNSNYPEISNIRSTYLKLVGELIYLSINTCPDISFIVNALTQHGSNPQPCHYAAGKQVLQYLAGTIQFRIVYTAEGDNLDLHAYTDASWANEIGCCSVTGYMWYYAGSLISHVSKKQTTVALSSTKAEYMAVTHIAQEGLWLHSLFFELGIAFRSPVPIHLDCAGTIALSEAA